MRNAPALMIAAALAVSLSAPSHAHKRWPVVPTEAGARPVGSVGWVPARCSDGPAFNLYHEAYYNAPPALWLGYAYRPFYRYTAYRAIPRSYACTE
jgi:hypothetical protein